MQTTFFHFFQTFYYPIYYTYSISVQVAIIDNYPWNSLTNHSKMSDKRIEGFTLAVGNVVGKQNFQIIHVSQADFAHDLPGFDRVILSGSPDNLANEDDTENSVVISKFHNEIQFLQTTHKPVLGICFGHELLAVAFGFRCQNMKNRDTEVYQAGQNHLLRFQKSFPLFPSSTICVDFSHTQEIKEEDPQYLKRFDDLFDVFASTPNCQIQIIQMKDRSRKLFGVQFHPETMVTPQAQRDGFTLIANFLNMS